MGSSRSVSIRRWPLLDLLRAHLEDAGVEEGRQAALLAGPGVPFGRRVHGRPLVPKAGGEVVGSPSPERHEPAPSPGWAKRTC